MPPALPWLHRGTTAATRGVAPRAVARNGRAAPRTARVTCRASNMVLEVMRVATGGHDIQKTRAAIADTRCRAKHFATCKQWEKNVCYGNRIRPECAPKQATRADARGFERPGACSCSSTTARAHPATRSTFPVVGIGAWSSSSSSSIFGNISAVETRRAWEKTANT